jgi:homoserine O-acetyltransferase
MTRSGGCRHPDADEEPGQRLYLELAGPIALERGGTLPVVRVAYETWGTLSPDHSNAVLVLHALTGDSHAAGTTGTGHPTPGWWDALIGPGRPLDTNRYFVVAPNVLGGCRGTTGPASPAPDGRPWGSRFPPITIRDQVVVEQRLAEALRIDRWAAVVGGSMGGMRTLEWAVQFPERVAAMLVLAVGAYATADQIGLQSAQLLCIRQDPAFCGGDYYAQPAGPDAGLGLARRIAQLSYRSEGELDARFGHEPQPSEDPLVDGRYAVQSYLDHHAAKLVGRFDANSYLVLTDAMNTHDIGRGRGGTSAALERVTARAVVAGISSDRLYPLRLQAEIATSLDTCPELRVVESPHGHDAFLIEGGQVGALVTDLLSDESARIDPGREAARAVG